MQLTISSRGQALTESIREHIQARLTAALDQHATRVKHVEVVLNDENGPRGGIDQVCRVSVRLNNGNTLHHTRRGLDLYANVSHLADTVKRRVGRELGRLRSKR